MRKLKDRIRIPEAVPRQEGATAPTLGAGSEPFYLQGRDKAVPVPVPEQFFRRPPEPVS